MLQLSFVGFFDIFRIRQCDKAVFFYKVQQILQTASGITKFDGYKVRRNRELDYQKTLRTFYMDNLLCNDTKFYGSWGWFRLGYH